MLDQRKLNAYLLLSIVASNCLLLTYAYPQQEVYQRQQQLSQSQSQSPVYRPESSARKFAVKPNASKKVALDDIEEDIDGNQIQESIGGPGGFTWSNMLSTVMTMFFNNAANAPTKSDDVDSSIGLGGSPWANVISMGLRIINTLLGGGAPSDGIDKVDNGGSPMQFIQIVMNLLDALKTSFSHRSLTARSMGKRDSVSDAAVAGIALLKGYVRTYRNSEDKCMQRYMCDANTDCVREIGGSSIFCQLGSYATSYALGRSSNTSFEHLYDAGRRGRSGFDCRQLYLECNEV
ncbi:uncharacterized protein LOC132785699 isoform X2 [Drosophila nasuta]|uniref:Uncharacterized protein LOC117574700 isoform X2 n=1 Tax=Drosophila albomicans TaxID=7291 RepID=A0A6P8XNA4_DROAB|nr:uncharacterized protein LOC117574700 isoform X2 [Drosophila albomicans]XP_060647896.1 uncharacterized protein LOC132785699 isoform X2 [Drosophila nasuta]